MSTVQLSVSTFGATIAHPPQHARRSACRSLFGPVDHDELNRDIEAKLRESSERDQKRWNFNFVSGTPLHGDYEWEGAAADTTPAFYQETVRVGKTRAALALHAKSRAQAPDCENTARDDAARGARSLTRMSCTRTPKRSKTSPRLTSSRITGGREAALKRRTCCDVC